MSQQQPPGPYDQPIPEPSQPVLPPSPQQERAAKAKIARNSMIAGGAVAAIGLAITCGSYVLVPEGGRYVIAWGAVIFGGLQFVIGLVNWLRNQ